MTGKVLICVSLTPDPIVFLLLFLSVQIILGSAYFLRVMPFNKTFMKKIIIKIEIEELHKSNYVVEKILAIYLGRDYRAHVAKD